MSASSCWRLATSVLARQMRGLSLTNPLGNGVGSGTLRGKTARSSLHTATFPAANTTTTAAAVAITTANNTTTRTFATKKKSSKNKRNKKKKRRPGAAPIDVNVSSTKRKRVVETPLQHEEWVKFQQSIAVEGFETGQTVQVINQGSRRSIMKNQERMAKEAQARLAERKRLTKVGGGRFPPLRYSPEETERLLAEAYAAVPKRTGKRGTKNLKRQFRRWFLVRKIRKKYKAHMARFQERKMIKRSVKAAAVKKVLQEAPTHRQRDREYQAQVFAKWANLMVRDREEKDHDGYSINEDVAEITQGETQKQGL